MLQQRHQCQQTQITVFENGDTGEEEGSWRGGGVWRGGGGETRRAGRWRGAALVGSD